MQPGTRTEASGGGAGQDSLAGVTPIAIDDSRWLEFVEACADAQPFHHPAWAGVLDECYGYRSLALALMDGDGRIVAGLPALEVKRPWGDRRWICLPFTDHCAPLARTAEARAELVPALAAARVRANVSRIEVRAPLEGSGTHANSSFVMHTLRLGQDPEAVFRTFKRTQVRQRIAKAERDGVIVRRADALGELTDIFYRLHTATRRRLGVPVQPRRFFRLLDERIFERGLGFLLLAYHEDTPIAGAVFLAWNGTLTYKYSASDTRFLRHRPNNLVLWTAIRWGCENGYHVLDMGRSGLNDHGLRDFKNGWGTREEGLSYTDIAAGPSRHWLGSREKALAPLIRRSPPWVTQLAGELLYKHAL